MINLQCSAQSDFIAKAIFADIVLATKHITILLAHKDKNLLDKTFYNIKKLIGVCAFEDVKYHTDVAIFGPKFHFARVLLQEHNYEQLAGVCDHNIIVYYDKSISEKHWQVMTSYLYTEKNTIAIELV
jgi:hypothetical protein